MNDKIRTNIIRVRKKWGLYPVTRVISSKKIYNRAKTKQYTIKEIKDVDYE